MAQPGSIAVPATPTPRYELRVRQLGPADSEYEVWQLPSPATPQVTTPTRVAGLRGRNLDLVEHRVLRKLARFGIRLGSGAVRGKAGQQGKAKANDHALTEDLALTLGLLFRALAPMRNRENMRSVAEGVEAMQREEAAYWLGMAMHRKRPRRVLAALRMLLTEPTAGATRERMERERHRLARETMPRVEVTKSASEHRLEAGTDIGALA